MSTSQGFMSAGKSEPYCIKKCASMQIEDYNEYLDQLTRECVICGRFSLEARYGTFEDDEQ